MSSKIINVSIKTRWKKINGKKSGLRQLLTHLFAKSACASVTENKFWQNLPDHFIIEQFPKNISAHVSLLYFRQVRDQKVNIVIF